MRQVVLALALWGCGGATGATRAAAPAHAIENTAEPVTPSEVNLEPGKGIGPVTLGMTRAQVATALVAKPEIDPAYADYDQFQDRGFEVEYDDEGRAKSIHAYSSEQGGFETRTRAAFPLHGLAGIHWGSTYDDIVAAMGSAVETGELPEAPIPTRWISYGDVMFDFITSNGHLFHVAVFTKD